MKALPDMEPELDPKLDLVMPGSTKQDRDCQGALVDLTKVVHGRRTVAEGDKETHRSMVNSKSSMPWKYEWILRIPGGWHMMLHAFQA